MILVIGKSGQIATALKQVDPARVHCLSQMECDLLHPHQVADRLSPFLKTGQFKFVINAAAYTQVDKAESENDACFNINALSPIEIAKVCADAQIPFVHYSSDYVYGSNSNEFLTETSPCSPLNFYAKSKLHADLEIKKINSCAMILRTSWVYDHQGKNFLTTMLKLFKTQSELKIVGDQFGAPTCAQTIATTTFQLLGALSDLKKTEIIHLTQATTPAHPPVSWYQFAKMILEESKKRGLNPITKNILPLSSSEWPTPAKRQLNSRLSLEKLTKEFKIKTPTIAEGLFSTIQTYSIIN